MKYGIILDYQEVEGADMKRKKHMRDRRLYVNAGMSYPTCKSDSKLLDCELGWDVTVHAEDVTCVNCRKRMKSNNI